MKRPIKLIVQLTYDEARALQQAIDNYFSTYGLSDSAASDHMEQMHSKVSDALVFGGYHCDCDGFDGSSSLN